MKVLDLFLPDEAVENVYAVTPAFCAGMGVEAVVFDVDNTLVPYDVAQPDGRLKEHLLGFPAAGIPVALVSNNSRERVEIFDRDLGFFAVPDAHKPKKSALAPVLAHFSLPPERVLLVGDQLLTDVLTARRNGMRAVVVPPVKRRENLFFRFKRMLEAPLMRRYRRLRARRKT
ncbi:MAG: YqeG family HAD IIIA-type phosphatase [Clostridia bacterium]|nr:YqeG family HAD IIIA-type phosphatase [Clostridia bacterium]